MDANGAAIGDSDRPRDKSTDEKQPTLLGSLKDIGTVIGSVCGAIAIGWNFFNSRSNFLQVELALSLKGKYLIAHTKIENKGYPAKAIDNAILLIGPENEKPVETANAFSQCLIERLKEKQERLMNAQSSTMSANKSHTQQHVTPSQFNGLNESEHALLSRLLRDRPIRVLDELEGACLETPIFDGFGRALIPILFYYYENVNFADERTGYDVPVEIDKLKPSPPCSAVRFIIFSSSKHRLCRIVEATYVSV